VCRQKSALTTYVQHPLEIYPLTSMREVKAQRLPAVCDYLIACSARVCDKYNNVKELSDIRQTPREMLFIVYCWSAALFHEIRAQISYAEAAVLAERHIICALSRPKAF